MNKSSFLILTFLLFNILLTNCKQDDNITKNITDTINNDENSNNEDIIKLPKRSIAPPETTDNVPHIQLNVEPIPAVNAELYRRVYSIPGIINKESVISSDWRSLWISNSVNIIKTEAIIQEREFGHIHLDGSLHIFLKPERSIEAVETCWAIYHPFAVQNISGWEGFVMLYTPQSLEELNVTFQLIVDAYNYVTGKNIFASDFY